MSLRNPFPDWYLSEAPMTEVSLKWRAFEDSEVGLVGARLDRGIGLRVLEASEGTGYEAWLDRYDETHFGDTAYPTVEAAQLAGVRLAQKLERPSLEDLEDQVAYYREEEAQGRGDPADDLEGLTEDLEETRALLERLDKEERQLQEA